MNNEDNKPKEQIEKMDKQQVTIMELFKAIANEKTLTTVEVWLSNKKSIEEKNLEIEKYESIQYWQTEKLGLSE